MHQQFLALHRAQPMPDRSIGDGLMQIDTSHLNAIRIRLSHERERLAVSNSESERKQRAVWVAGIERELASELKFLGLPSDTPSDPIDDDALFDELFR